MREIMSQIKTKEVENLRKLLEVQELEKIDLIAQMLSTSNRSQLDILKTRHPELVKFIIQHYSEFSKEI